MVSRYIRTTKTVHMFKKGIAFTLLLAVMGWAVLVLVGCLPRSVTFTDGAGRTIELEKAPERIVSCHPPTPRSCSPWAWAKRWWV